MYGYRIDFSAFLPVRPSASVACCSRCSPRASRPPSYFAVRRLVVHHTRKGEVYCTGYPSRLSGASCKKVIWGHQPPSPPFLPFSTLSLPLEVGPLLRLGGLGERFSCPSGSGRSPAAKRYLVNVRQKYSLK